MDPVQPQSKKAIGPIIGIVVIVVLLVIGAFYVWGNKMGNPSASTETSKMAPVSSSDDVSAIDADLQADGTLDVDLSELDSI